MDIFNGLHISRMIDFHLRESLKFLNNGNMFLYKWHKKKAKKLLKKINS